ncbi:unnamed protein product [Polarella glacialis]|uniref:Uncharacterized protein n=1 Tax=Polarella glacialis TaxID=89957 RepID=A0A813GZL2_POLGL|nr:unnamed protein product [Polarella glacialis]CAE8657988.1 unnamed protein product [Polarella glacialis]
MAMDKLRLDTAAIFGVSVILMALKPLLLFLTGDAGDKLSKAPVTLPPAYFQLVVESIKAVVCTAALSGQRLAGVPAPLWNGWLHTSSFALPAAVYLVMNILTVHAARMLPPPTMQLVASVKILFTAVMSWLLMARQLHRRQWLAMVCLTFGVAIGGRAGGASANASSDRELPEAPVLGIVIMLINCALSAFGGVCTEMALKARSSGNLSIFATNLHMAAHSLLMNGAALALWLPAELPQWDQLSRTDLLALGNEAMNGILISLLMRRIDSIAKNYAFGASIFMTAGLSALFLDYRPPPQYYLGAGLTVMSMAMYANGGGGQQVAPAGKVQPKDPKLRE